MPLLTGKSALMKYTAMHNPTATDDFIILAPMGGNISFIIFTPLKSAYPMRISAFAQIVMIRCSFFMSL